MTPVAAAKAAPASVISSSTDGPPSEADPPVVGTAAAVRAGVAVAAFVGVAVPAAAVVAGVGLAVAPVAAGVGVALWAATTVMRPIIIVGWKLQWYSKVPGVKKVCEKLWLAESAPESKPPVGGQVVKLESHCVTV